MELWCSVWSWAGQSQGSTNVSNNQFTPNPPADTPYVVDVWQYGAQCFPYRGDLTKSFDMNLASQTGYDMMWRC
jgi:hypothetical protein